MSFRRAQSRTGLLVEAATNVMVGYGLAVAAQHLLFPLFGIHTSLAQDGAIAGVFTGISLVRSFILRRLFERIGAGRGRNGRLQRGRTYRLVEEA